MRVNIYKHEAPNNKRAYVTVMVLKDKAVGRIQSPIRDTFVRKDLEAMKKLMMEQRHEYDYCVIPDSKIFFNI